MHIPSGDWMVITRSIRDTASPGLVYAAGLTERAARLKAEWLRAYPDCGYHVWILRREDY